MHESNARPLLSKHTSSTHTLSSSRRSMCPLDYKNTCCLPRWCRHCCWFVQRWLAWLALGCLLPAFLPTPDCSLSLPFSSYNENASRSCRRGEQTPPPLSLSRVVPKLYLHTLPRSPPYLLKHKTRGGAPFAPAAPHTVCHHPTLHPTPEIRSRWIVVNRQAEGRAGQGGGAHVQACPSSSSKAAEATHAPLALPSQPTNSNPAP